MRAPDHGRPYDFPWRCDDPPPTAIEPTVDVADDDPQVALYGPDGAPLLWRNVRRPFGFRRLTAEDA